MMHNVVVRLAYDGTRYFGWQQTSSDHARFPSVEHEVTSVLQQILQHPVVLQAASRTDRGVHAVGQAANFHTSHAPSTYARLLRSLNQLLPSDVAVLSVEPARSPNFHATIDATAKEYVYRLCHGRVLLPHLRFTHAHFPCAPDMAQMARAVELLLGEHDFASFRNFRKGQVYRDTVRRLFAIHISEEPGDILEFRLVANNFLYKMARNIAGTLLYVGIGKLSLGQVASLLRTPDRTKAGVTLPAQGLTLQRVFYEDVEASGLHYL